MTASVRIIHHDTGKTDIFVGEEEILTLIEELADELDSIRRFHTNEEGQSITGYPYEYANRLFNRAQAVLEES